MKITVLTSTYRFFMKDKQIEALAAQTLKDFEWIIVDDCYEENKGIKFPFNAIHMPPREVMPYFALSSCFNDGLVRASGKYIFFMNDYVMPNPACLQRHWEVQEKMGGCMLSGRALAVNGNPAFVDGKSMMLEDYRMAVFDSETIPSKDIGGGLREVDRNGVQSWWAGRNDSAPLEAILCCNGFEEAYDGRWGGHDADLANRLMTYGLKYYLDRNSTCAEYDHPRGNKKEVRTEAQQQGLEELIIKPKAKAGIHTANDLWLVFMPRDIREERKQCQK